MAKKSDTFDEAKESGTTLEAFIIPQRVAAFKDAYQPCGERCATETFDETRLRDFFKAWPCSLGDPLQIYLSELERVGFMLQVSRTGTLAIFAIERNAGSTALTI